MGNTSSHLKPADGVVTLNVYAVITLYSQAVRFLYEAVIT